MFTMYKDRVLQGYPSVRHFPVSVETGDQLLTTESHLVEVTMKLVIEARAR